jgi:outer membrane protein insertion porin family
MHRTFQKKLLNIFLLFFILSASVSFAQITRTNLKIVSISVQGNRSADANTVIAASGLKVGDEIQIPGDQTLNAIRQLYALDIFSDVQILIDKQVQDGVYLVIKVDEHPRFEQAVFVGNDELSNSDIEGKINFMKGQVLKPQAVERMRQRIISAYEEEGYFNSEINIKYFEFFRADTTDRELIVTWRNRYLLSEEHQTKYPRNEAIGTNLLSRLRERVLLKLEITENEPVVVRRVEFRGNEKFSDGDLRGEMDEIEESKWWKFWKSFKFDPQKLEEDKNLIKRYYMKNGYRDAEIISDSLIYYNNNKDLHIILFVHEGPQYKVRNITFEGNTVYPDELLRARLDFEPGEIYNYEKFERNLRQNETQSDISALYLDNGYLTFNVRSTETRVGEDSIDIAIRIEEKNQFKIGRVDIAGNTKTKDKVIRRELYTIPGDFFNRALLYRSMQQLANLQYFNVERLYGPQGLDYNLVNDSTVNVAFNVEEKSSDYLNASVGYSGSFGFSGAVGVTLTNFSMAEPFSLGGGQVLSFNWQFGVGNVYRTFTVGFTEPWLFDTPTLIGFEVFDTRQRYIYDLRQSGGTMRLGRRLKWPDDFFYVQGLLRYQYNNVIEGQNFYREGTTDQFTLGGTISRRNIDNPIFPSQGSNVSLEAEISGGPFLPGDVDYLKLNLRAEWYKRLFHSNRITLYTVADWGYLEELTPGTPIQPFEYYFMGGNGLVIATTPLRGYDDRSVGPLVNGRVIGGRVMTRYTTELRFAVTLEPIPLYLLAFAEAGNTFESFEKADLFDLRRSVGVGARLLINPIGLIGFDLGYGFDRKLVSGKDPSWLFHFQFGRGF